MQLVFFPAEQQEFEARPGQSIIISTSMNADYPIDYLLLGHVSKDIYPESQRLGGTVTYAGLTAFRLGRTVGVITSCSGQEDLSELAGLKVEVANAKHSTSFMNQYRAGKRTQRLLRRAGDLDFDSIPAGWRQAEIVHLGPIAAEVDLTLFHRFPESFLAVTPQGWLRGWDEEGRVHAIGWEVLKGFIEAADAVVLSEEDLGSDGAAEVSLAKCCKVMAVTCGQDGVRLYVDSLRHSLPTLEVPERDPTGSGDIFAAVFFVLLQKTGDAVAAAQTASLLAAGSVRRTGLAGVPSLQELAEAVPEV